jgi:hypothetical protein
VKALLKFKGQGRISQVFKAGRWPKSAEETVLQVLKDTLEAHGTQGGETKLKRTIQSKKRKRAGKAAMAAAAVAAAFDMLIDPALINGV